MAKFKVLKEFKDKNTKELYDVNSEIELTKKRAKEIVDKLGDSFLIEVKK